MSKNHWINKKREKVIILISLSTLEHAEVSKEFKYLTGSDNPYENIDQWNIIKSRHQRKIELENVSLLEAEKFAEPIRIVNPDECISIISGDGYIGNVSWNDQVRIFFEYPTYTKIGKSIIDKRKEEAKRLGIQASFE